MCGIFGIISEKENVFEKIYLALMNLQHRGNEAAGIGKGMIYEKNINIIKDIGLVTEVFKEKEIADAKGNIGIGHVRYGTTGNNSKNEAQPFKIVSPINIAMVSNGNTINKAALVEYLDKNKISLHSTSDLEMILEVFMLEVKKIAGGSEITSKIIFQAARALMDLISGSYSLIAMIEGVGLLAIRDPLGIRPLIIGESADEKNKAYVFASESVAIDVLDYKILNDVRPGEAVLINPSFEIERRILKEGKKVAHCAFEYIYFARPDSVIDGKLVYGVRLKLGESLAEIFAPEDADSVVAVPDTSRPFAQSYAEKTKIRNREGLIKNRYIGRTFIMPSVKKRENAIRLKLNPISMEIDDKVIVLIDDSIVRGTTSKKIVALLKKAGAKKIYMLPASPPITHPCVLGIDMPTFNELIAHEKTIEEIRKYLKADALIYQTIDGLVRSIGIERDKLCLACFTGEYPIPISKEELLAIGERRQKEKKE